MPTQTTKGLIINSPYTEPTSYWRYITETRKLEPESGRRKAGYLAANPKAKAHDDPGIFVPIPLVNRIRPRVAEWRDAGYSGVTGITRRLLQHWNDKDQRDYPFFFCQLEAIETLIWLVEAPDSAKTGIDVPTDGGEFQRLCSKLATGTGKTVVMAMLIAWQVLNKTAYPQDTRFSGNILIIAPGLTVRRRLAVLDVTDDNNYYDEFHIVPSALKDKLRRGKIIVRNWHALSWESEEKIAKKKSVDKRGAKSDEAYTREVLGELATAKNLVVINDEAHHAWRINDEAKGKYLRQRDMKDSAEEATVWVGGLDRIHRQRRILRCFDFSATPFTPSGNQTAAEALFGWIVSDFGLNDAIESGLVKTPRMVVRDDALPNAETYRSRLYHIYSDPEVKGDLNRKAEPQEPLPDLVTNAYYLLGYDWKEAKKDWGESRQKTPPVMITVANRIETAARVKHAFDRKNIQIDELCQPGGILHIDSKVLKEAEARERDIEETKTDSEEMADKPRLTKKEISEQLRETVNTVGQEGKPGAGIQNVISVGMLSEGWDARTVTHIMGLRAFSSQLLCEQVVGRGLRRASYEINEESGHFEPEYVNVFGVPFTFLPHENEPGIAPPPSQPKVIVKPAPEKAEFAIKWPNLLRIDRTYRPQLSLDWNKIEPLVLDTANTVQIAEMAPTVNGKPAVSEIRDIDLDNLAKELRTQALIFRAARDVWDQMNPSWTGSSAVLMAQLVGLAQHYIESDRIDIVPELFNQDEKRRRLVIVLNMTRVVRHMWQAIEFGNTESKMPCFDRDHPIRSTDDMRPWRTGKPCAPAAHSHINFCVFDSTWEASESFELDRNEQVAAWAKNDHLGFQVPYVYNGVVRTYWPDFIIRLASGDFMVLETKGQQTEADDAKHDYMREWIEAVNQHGGFGHWRFDVSRQPSDVKDVLEKHGGTPATAETKF